MFSESCLSTVLSKKFKIGSIGIPSKILATFLGETCRNGGLGVPKKVLRLVNNRTKSFAPFSKYLLFWID